MSALVRMPFAKGKTMRLVIIQWSENEEILSYQYERKVRNDHTILWNNRLYEIGVELPSKTRGSLCETPHDPTAGGS